MIGNFTAELDAGEFEDGSGAVGKVNLDPGI
jgi:hypothetical protein